MMKRSLEESSRSYNMSWLRRWVDDGRSNSRDEEGGQNHRSMMVASTSRISMMIAVSVMMGKPINGSVVSGIANSKSNVSDSVTL